MLVGDDDGGDVDSVHVTVKDNLKFVSNAKAACWSRVIAFRGSCCHSVVTVKLHRISSSITK